jgi:hypothetical protein
MAMSLKSVVAALSRAKACDLKPKHRRGKQKAGSRLNQSTDDAARAF